MLNDLTFITLLSAGYTGYKAYERHSMTKHLSVDQMTVLKKLIDHAQSEGVDILVEYIREVNEGVQLLQNIDPFIIKEYACYTRKIMLGAMFTGVFGALGASCYLTENADSDSENLSGVSKEELLEL